MTADLPVVHPSNLPDDQRVRALWACALYDAQGGDTTDLQTLICEGPIPDEHRAAVAALVAKAKKPKRGKRRILTSEEVIAIHDVRNTSDKMVKILKAELAPKYGVKPSMIADVLACHNTFKWVRALRYRYAKSTATFTIGGTAAGTLVPIGSKAAATVKPRGKKRA